MIKVVIADDHNLVRDALKDYLEADCNIKVVASVETAQKALDSCILLKPDILLLDIEFPDMNGFKVLKRLKTMSINVKTIFLTMHKKVSYLTEGLTSGIKGYVLKDSSPESLCRAVKKVYEGEIYIVSEMSYRMAMYFEKENSNNVDVLSQREKEILIAVAKGRSLKEMSYKLNLSISSVSTYKARAKEKLGLSKDADIVRWCYEKGLM